MKKKAGRKPFSTDPNRKLILCWWYLEKWQKKVVQKEAKRRKISESQVIREIDWFNRVVE